MIPNYKSSYTAHANKTLYWISGDSEKLYNQHLKYKYNELVKHNWIDSNFTYEFNSHGFRCSEFTDSPTAMFLGCSFTIGVGLPIDTIWPEIVSTNLKLKCANLGIAAGAPDTAFRLCHGYIDRVNPKIIFYMQPPSGRFEIIDKLPHIYGPWANNTTLYRDWAADENNIFFNQEKNLLAIKMMCHERNIKFISVDYSELEIDDSLARDLGHFGISCHSGLANKLLNSVV